MPAWLKITVALYGVVLIANLALRQAVLAEHPTPGAKMGWGLLLLLLALIWAVGLAVWLGVHRKRLSRRENAAGSLPPTVLLP